MKFKKLAITAILAISFGMSAQSHATVVYTPGITNGVDQGMGVIGTAPTQPTGAISTNSPKPFAFNITNINNTFGIRADRPLDLRLLKHGIETIYTLLSQGRITFDQYSKLYSHIIKYSSNTACKQYYGVPCVVLR